MPAQPADRAFSAENAPTAGPVCPEAPRWCPHAALPAYRHVPSVTPHPVTDPRGHSHGQAESSPPDLPPEAWRDNEAYLWAIDLYNQGYLWESHEVWEGLWRAAGRGSRQGQFYQGLIFNSAAQLKVLTGRLRGAATHGQRSLHRLEHAAAGEDVYMGLSLPSLTAALRTYYAPLWETPPGPPRTKPPCLIPRLD